MYSGIVQRADSTNGVAHLGIRKPFAGKLDLQFPDGSNVKYQTAWDYAIDKLMQGNLADLMQAMTNLPDAPSLPNCDGLRFCVDGRVYPPNMTVRQFHNLVNLDTAKLIIKEAKQIRQADVQHTLMQQTNLHWTVNDGYFQFLQPINDHTELKQFERMFLERVPENLRDKVQFDAYKGNCRIQLYSNGPLQILKANIPIKRGASQQEIRAMKSDLEQRTGLEWISMHYVDRNSSDLACWHYLPPGANPEDLKNKLSAEYRGQLNYHIEQAGITQFAVDPSGKYDFYSANILIDDCCRLLGNM